MWLWVNHVYFLTSFSSSGKCRTHNSTCPLGLLWGQMTNVKQSTESGFTSHDHKCSVTAAQQCSQHYWPPWTSCVFSHMFLPRICGCMVWCSITGFSFFLSYVLASSYHCIQSDSYCLLFLHLAGIKIKMGGPRIESEFCYLWNHRNKKKLKKNKWDWNRVIKTEGGKAFQFCLSGLLIF